jgi:hypothetical protein
MEKLNQARSPALTRTARIVPLTRPQTVTSCAMTLPSTCGGRRPGGFRLCDACADDVLQRYTQRSLKWSAEIRQHPHGEQINTQQRLNSRDDPHPTSGTKRIFSGLYTCNPSADVEVAPPNMESREERNTLSDRPPPGYRIGAG